MHSVTQNVAYFLLLVLLSKIWPWQPGHPLQFLQENIKPWCSQMEWSQRRKGGRISWGPHAVKGRGAPAPAPGGGGRAPPRPARGYGDRRGRPGRTGAPAGEHHEGPVVAAPHREGGRERERGARPGKERGLVAAGAWPGAPPHWRPATAGGRCTATSGEGERECARARAGAPPHRSWREGEISGELERERERVRARMHPGPATRSAGSTPGGARRPPVRATQ